MRLSLTSKYNVSQVVQLVLLFLVNLNFANLYFYIIFLAFFVCVLTNIRSLKVDIISILLALISICYILFYPPTRDSYTTILKQFAYPMCYLIGLNLFDNNLTNQTNHDADKQIKLSILVASMGAFLHYLLNAFINIDSLLRNTEDFWTGEVVSATGQALLAIMGLGVFSVWLVGNYPMWKKVLSLFGLIVIFAYNFVLAGRAILIIGIITVFIAFVNAQRYAHANGRIRNYLFLAVIFTGAIILFLNNAWGIRDWALNSNLGIRFERQEALEDIRFQRKMLYIANMLDYPFGGGLLREEIGGYAHELYLDAFSDVGILGYGLIIASVILCMVNVIKLIRSKILSVESKNLLICVFLGINIVVFLEPIIQCAPWLFCAFCFLSGVSRCTVLLLNDD